MFLLHSYIGLVWANVGMYFSIHVEVEIRCSSLRYYSDCCGLLGPVVSGWGSLGH